METDVERVLTLKGEEFWTMMDSERCLSKVIYRSASGAVMPEDSELNGLQLDGLRVQACQ